MLRWQRALQPGWLRSREVSDTHLHLPNLETGSEITGEATTANAGRSGRRTVVLFDELARVDNSAQGRITPALRRATWSYSGGAEL